MGYGLLINSLLAMGLYDFQIVFYEAVLENYLHRFI